MPGARDVAEEVARRDVAGREGQVARSAVAARGAEQAARLAVGDVHVALVIGVLQPDLDGS